MACLDTSFLVDVLRADSGARDVLEDLENEGSRPSVTPVAAAELWIGANLGTRAEYDATGELLESLIWLEFSPSCARRAGELQAELIRDGSELGFADCMIAAAAIEYDESLVTRDSDFERIPDLRVQTYG